MVDIDRENPDFIDCAGCGGEFYCGDLIDELCADCRDADDNDGGTSVLDGGQ